MFGSLAFKALRFWVSRATLIWYVIFLIALAIWVYRIYMKHKLSVERAQAYYIAKNVPLTSQNIPEPSKEISEKVLAATATELLEMMENKELTSAQIVATYIYRAENVGRKLNAITEEFFTEAYEAARASDARRSQSQPPRILEGLPISVKDCFDQKGADSMCGIAARGGRPSPEDGMMLQLLREEGAIPFVRSNTPPVLMAAETSNNVIGKTLNPWDLTRVAGGSSGGEAALIAAKCSPFGVGTDIGGSVRIPAELCGIYSFKCTTRRLSTKGLKDQEVPGQTHILSMPGPMARSVDDLVLILRAWLSTESKIWQRDPYLPPIPWRDTMTWKNSSESKQFRIGYFTYNGFWTVPPATLRAVNEVTQRLSKVDGIEVVQWTPPKLDESIRLVLSVFCADRWKWCRKELGDELPHVTILENVIMGRLPAIVCRGLSWLLRRLKQERLAEILYHSFGQSFSSPAAIWELQDRVKQYQELVLSSWRSNNLDIVVCPGYGFHAVKHHQSFHFYPMHTYTSLWNLLQYPVGHVPTTTVGKDECSYDPKSVPVFEQDMMFKLAEKELKDAAGLPVGVQVIGLPFKDEVVVSVMKLIEQLFPFPLPNLPVGE